MSVSAHQKARRSLSTPYLFKSRHGIWYFRLVVPESALSTISREIQCNQKLGRRYTTHSAECLCKARRIRCHPKRKLVLGGERFEMIRYMLWRHLSPEQLSRKLKRMNIPDLRDVYVCREMIYSAIYASAVGILVELKSGYLILAKMNGATATAFSAVAGFSAALNRMPLTAGKSLTYGWGSEMAQQANITQSTGVAIYFCDPHRPWYRGDN